MRYLILLLILCFLVGCWGRPELPDLPDPPGGGVSSDPVTPPSGNPSDLEEADKDVAYYKAQLAAALARQQALEDAAQAQMRRRLQYTAWWIAGLSMLGSLGCAAAAIFLSVGRRLLITGFVAGLVLMILALTLSYLIPYLVWVGLTLAIVGVAAGVWYLYRLWSINQETAAVGVEALEELQRLGGQVSHAGLPTAALKAADRIKHEALHRQALLALAKDVERCIEPHKRIVKQKFLTADDAAYQEITHAKPH